MKQSLLQQENTAFKIQNKKVSLLIQKTKTKTKKIKIIGNYLQLQNMEAEVKVE